MIVIAAYNIKGGVGKTTAAVNLAYLAARSGAPTLLWDLDPQGAATYLFRIKPKVRGGGRALLAGKRPIDQAIRASDYDGLDLVPADFSYRNLDLRLDERKRPVRGIDRLLRPLAGEYEYVFLDCPPGASLLSESVLYAADIVLVPLIPATLSLRTFDQLLQFVAGAEVRTPSVRAFFSMADSRKRMHRDLVATMPAARPQLAATVIPAAAIVEGMGQRREPLVAFAPRSAPARAYEALWAELTTHESGPGRRP